MAYRFYLEGGYYYGVKDLKKLTNKAEEEEPAQATVAEICIVVFAGAAAGFFLAVQPGKYKYSVRKINFN